MTNAEALGLDPRAVDALVARARESVEAGHIPSCQLALARHGRLAMTATLGRATCQGRPVVPTDDTLYAVFSCTKGLMAAAAWILLEEGRLDPAERVAELIPEFGTNGKEAVTIEHLYLHTAGFPYAPFSPLDWEDRSRRLERFARWRLDWPPGSRFVYHPTSSMWVAAEVIERLSGLDYRRFIAERIAAPLGLPRLRVGVPEAEHAGIADVVYQGDAASADELAGAGWPAGGPAADASEETMLALNTPEVRRIGLPGGGAIATAADLALFYQALLPAAGAGRRLVRAETVARATTVRSAGLTDPIFGQPVSRAFGMVVAGERGRAYRGWGPTGSASMFGHNGAGGQIAWVDPESGLSFAFCTNGFDRNAVRQARRTVALSTRAAACIAA